MNRYSALQQQAESLQFGSEGGGGDEGDEGRFTDIQFEGGVGSAGGDPEAEMQIFF